MFRKRLIFLCKGEKILKEYLDFYEAPFGVLKLMANDRAITELQLLYKYPYKETMTGISFLKELLPSTQIQKLLEKEQNQMLQNMRGEKRSSSKIALEIKTTSLLEEAKTQLTEYFAQERTYFELPLEPAGTEFQTSVWKALQEIPYGETKSYKQIAEFIQNPKAQRAIGGANNKNPIFIVIPCHRVVGANGTLVGFGAGIDVKKYLLLLEDKTKQFEK